MREYTRITIPITWECPRRTCKRECYERYFRESRSVGRPWARQDVAQQVHPYHSIARDFRDLHARSSSLQRERKYLTGSCGSLRLHFTLTSDSKIDHHEQVRTGEGSPVWAILSHNSVMTCNLDQRSRPGLISCGGFPVPA